MNSSRNKQNKKTTEWCDTTWYDNDNYLHPNEMRKRKTSFAFPFLRFVRFFLRFVVKIIIAQIHLLFVFQNDMYKGINKRRQTAQWENRWFRLSLSVCVFILSPSFFGSSLSLDKYFYMERLGFIHIVYWAFEAHTTRNALRSQLFCCCYNFFFFSFLRIIEKRTFSFFFCFKFTHNQIHFPDFVNRENCRLLSSSLELQIAIEIDRTLPFC